MIIKGYAGRQLFPKHTDTQIGFKIVSFMPNNEYMDKLDLNNYGNITIKGELPSMFNDKEYEIDIQEDNSGKYECSYNVIRLLSNPMDMNRNQAHDYISELYNEKIASNILGAYPNFVQMIIDGKISEIDTNKISGVGMATLYGIEKKIKETIEMFEIITEYKEYELSLSQVKKMYDTYKSFTKLKAKMDLNPYRCLCSISGIGFKKADKLILNKNRQLITSKFRMVESINHVLKENESSGNTWMYVGELFRECSNLTPECIDNFTECIKTDKYLRYEEDKKRIARYQMYYCEKEILDRITGMLSNEGCRFEEDGVLYDNVDGFDLSDEQMAIQSVLKENNVCMLAGFGGSGKSFSTKAVCKMLDSLNLTYILLAPTGKASKNLADCTGRTASTIHRGLMWNPKDGFQYNENNKLAQDVIIVDEATMIDCKLMVSLLRAISEKRSKLMFICDPAQISSIGAGNCMQDLINKIPTATLTKVFRYENGGLAKVATDTREGKKFLTNDNIQKFGDDFCFVSANKEDMLDKVLSAYKKLITLGGTADTISIISAYNKGDYGTYNINSIIQNYINPPNGKLEYSYTRDKYEIRLRVGDRVMQTVNDYKAQIVEMICEGVYDIKDEKTTSIFNGDDGKIIDIIQDKMGAKSVIVDFYGELVIYKGMQINSLLLAYSISGHKSQGSSIPYIVVITPPTHKFFLNRNLLYVMYTRARKYVYNIGTTDTVDSAIKKSENLSRQTFLGEMYNEWLENNK